MATAETLTVVCHSVDPIKISLSGTGILKLAPGCSIKAKDVIIPASTFRTGQSEVIYESELHLNLTELSPSLSKYHHLLKESTIEINQELGLESKLFSFEANSKTLDDLEQQLHGLAFQRQLRGKQSYLVYGSYLGLVLLCVFLLLYILRLPLRNLTSILTTLICKRSRSEKIKISTLRKEFSTSKNRENSIQPYEEIETSQKSRRSPSEAPAPSHSASPPRSEIKHATFEENSPMKIK